MLDEPTNGLDPAGMADMRALIVDLAAGGQTVLLSSHLLAEVAGDLRPRRRHLRGRACSWSPRWPSCGAGDGSGSWPRRWTGPSRSAMRFTESTRQLDGDAVLLDVPDRPHARAGPRTRRLTGSTSTRSVVTERTLEEVFFEMTRIDHQPDDGLVEESGTEVLR